MSKNSDHVKRWREATKQRIVDSMGGCCQICGYSRCFKSLDLHHKNSAEKEFGMGAIRGNPKSWVKIVVELRKCVLLCRNCHGEFHAGVVKIPVTAQSFNEEYADYLTKQREKLWNECPVCGKRKMTQRIYCSHSCSGIGGGKVDWKIVDLEELLKTQSKVQVADDLGISETAVRKRLKKLRS
jgi:hypothetical protein